MEVPRIGLSYEQRHRAKMVFLHKGKIKFDWKFTPFLKKMKSKNENFKTICYDNACENKIFEENCAKKFEEINFEFISPGTPQKNGVIERGFATLYYWMKAMM